VFVVGTAGHVDHGKSTLVKALTGIDPDRLREEQERAMTIDLGFAWLTLPSGHEISLVDVPGHERFIKNMLAGVGGLDAALLVIAADEGPMPQTTEHLAILDLLGVAHGLGADKATVDDSGWSWSARVRERLRGASARRRCRIGAHRAGPGRAAGRAGCASIACPRARWLGRAAPTDRSRVHDWRLWDGGHRLCSGAAWRRRGGSCPAA
jgi:selenocysteine-specific elongation factor